MLVFDFSSSQAQWGTISTRAGMLGVCWNFSFHLSGLSFSVLLCLWGFFGVCFFSSSLSPFTDVWVCHFLCWSCAYLTEIGPFSLGKGRLRLRFRESCVPSTVHTASGWKEQYCFPLLCVSVWAFVFFFDAAVLSKRKKNPLIYGSSAYSDQLTALWNLSLRAVVIASINLPRAKYVGGTEIKSHLTTKAEEHKPTTRKLRWKLGERQMVQWFWSNLDEWLLQLVRGIQRCISFWRKLHVSCETHSWA